MDSTGIARSLLLLPTDVSVNEMPVIPTAWILPYEIAFYLVAVFLVAGKKRMFSVLAVSWAALMIAGQFISTRNLLFEFICAPLFIEFLYGVLIAGAIHRLDNKGIVVPARAISNIGLALLVMSWIGTNLEIGWIQSINRVFLFGIPFSFIIFGMVSRELSDGCAVRLKGFKLFSESSYSLYLVHYPLLLVVRAIGDRLEIPSLITFVAGAVVCVVAGVLGNKLIEKPITCLLVRGAGSGKATKRKYVCRYIIIAACTTSIVIMIFFLANNPKLIYSKKIQGAFVGDSITEQGKYLNTLELNYPIKGVNYGVAGATYGDCGSGMPLIHELAEKVSGNPDFIFVFAGTNDWGNKVPIGKDGDMTDSTFYGGVYMAFSKLRNNYPDTPIIVSTILQRNWTPSKEYPQPAGMLDNGIGLSVEDYNEVIIHVAHRYGCKVVDAYGESGITMENIRLYSDDGVHLNDTGGRKIASFIVKAINDSVE